MLTKSKISPKISPKIRMKYVLWSNVGPSLSGSGGQQQICNGPEKEKKKEEICSS